MATQIIERAMCNGKARKIVRRTVTSGQTFKKGEFVVDDTAGAMTVCASNAVSIYGMALADATDVDANSQIPVAVATDEQEFIMNVTGAVTAITQYDVKYALAVTSNIHYLDVSDTNYDAFMIKEILQGADKATGDTNGRVIACVLPAAQQFGATGT